MARPRPKAGIKDQMTLIQWKRSEAERVEFHSRNETVPCQPSSMAFSRALKVSEVYWDLWHSKARLKFSKSLGV